MSRPRPDFQEKKPVGGVSFISVPAHFLFAVAMGYYYSLVHFGYHGSEKDALRFGNALLEVPDQIRRHQIMMRNLLGY